MALFLLAVSLVTSSVTQAMEQKQDALVRFLTIVQMGNAEQISKANQELSLDAFDEELKGRSLLNLQNARLTIDTKYHALRKESKQKPEDKKSITKVSKELRKRRDHINTAIGKNSSIRLKPDQVKQAQAIAEVEQSTREGQVKSLAADESKGFRVLHINLSEGAPEGKESIAETAGSVLDATAVLASGKGNDISKVHRKRKRESEDTVAEKADEVTVAIEEASLVESDHKKSEEKRKDHTVAEKAPTKKSKISAEKIKKKIANVTAKKKKEAAVIGATGAMIAVAAVVVAFAYKYEITPHAAADKVKSFFNQLRHKIRNHITSSKSCNAIS